MKKAFTLIELLVVVLIIGILAAVALPQYQKSVEKARLTEALNNIKTIKNNFKLFLLENGGYPEEDVCLKDMGEAGELTGGTWDGCTYTTPHFEYYALRCSSVLCSAEISPFTNYDYTILLDDRNDEDGHHDTCFTQETDLGRYICKSLVSQGFEYRDEGY